MVRYWIEFDFTEYSKLTRGAKMGIGVTGFDYDDVIDIIKLKIFEGENMPPIKTAIRDVDVRTLDQNHVIQNMLPPNRRGIWYPIGYY
jgi:hypothetical protein